MKLLKGNNTLNVLITLVALIASITPLTAGSPPKYFEENSGQLKTAHPDSTARFILRASSSTWYFFDYGYSIVQQNRESGISSRIDFLFEEKIKVRPQAESYAANVRRIYPGIVAEYVFAKSIIYKNPVAGIDLRFVISGDTLIRTLQIGEEGRGKVLNFRVRGGIAHQQNDGIKIISPAGTICETLRKFEPGGQENISRAFAGNESTTAVEIIEWLTYLGGTSSDELFGIALLPSGGSVVAGRTVSNDFPSTPGAFQDTLAGNYDVTITRFDPDGNCLWSTFYGGTNFDGAYAVARINSSIVVTGATNSLDLPMLNATQNSNGGGYDAFVLVLNDSGMIVRSTYFGGTGSEQGFSLAADTSGRIVLGGSTTSTDLPGASSGYQPALAGMIDAFLLVADTLLQPQWSTYYGGSNVEDIHALTVTQQGEIAFCGGTRSFDFPVTPDAYQTGLLSQPDIYLVKFGMDGSRHYATFFGGTNNDDANAIVSDSSGRLYLTGVTYSFDFPVAGNTFQSVIAAQADCFVTCFDTAGQLNWSTFVGGNGLESGLTISISGKYIFIGGNTESSDFPIGPEAVQAFYGGNSDGFVIKMDTTGEMVSGTFIGAGMTDAIYGLVVTSDTSVIACADTYSNNLAVTPGAFQSNYAGSGDGFVLKFKMSEELNSMGSPVTASSFNSISAYPNPAAGEIHLVAEETIIRVQLIDATGRTAMEVDCNSEEATIGITELPKGIYLVRVYSATGNVSLARFIKL
jgi:hypothetical protein